MSTTVLKVFRGGSPTGGLRGRLGPAKQLWFDGVVVGLVVLLVLLAAFGGLLAPNDPFLVDLGKAFIPPGPQHLLGTDESGRDVLSRLMTGAGTTLLSALVIALSAGVIGVIIAALASLAGGWLDEAVMRLCDIVLAIPALILALGIAMALGPSLQSAIIALIVAMWPGTTRIVRSSMRKNMEEPYVEAARSQGASKWNVVFRHVIPNSLDVAIVDTAFSIGGITLILASLSFIGVGAQPPSPEWGAMAADGRSYVLTSWWITVAPGLAIMVAAVAFGLLGEVLQARFNPSQGRR
ncbi:ABC transporter permease [Microbacterium sp. 2MCAF23]|uniref:ABC transporter permease n=1 Tax=Microbacterium sp. 2MCAF23 TaxID=3232985 RepID=UPI003F96EAC2